MSNKTLRPWMVRAYADYARTIGALPELQVLRLCDTIVQLEAELYALLDRVGESVALIERIQDDKFASVLERPIWSDLQEIIDVRSEENNDTR